MKFKLDKKEVLAENLLMKIMRL